MTIEITDAMVDTFREAYIAKDDGITSTHNECVRVALAAALAASGLVERVRVMADERGAWMDRATAAEERVRELEAGIAIQQRLVRLWTTESHDQQGQIDALTPLAKLGLWALDAQTRSHTAMLREAVVVGVIAGDTELVETSATTAARKLLAEDA